MIQNNYDSTWKKIFGFRNMQEKLENLFICVNSSADLTLQFFKAVLENNNDYDTFRSK